MGIIQFEQNGVKYLVVEAPGNSFDYIIRQNSDNCDLWYKSHYGDSDISNWIELPYDKCEIVGKLSDLTEDQAAEMVKCNNNTYIKTHYWNYTEERIGIFRFQYLSAIDSLKSRIRSLGGSDDANYVILKGV